MHFVTNASTIASNKQMNKMHDDENVLKRIKEGHIEDFALLVNKYKGMAYSIAYRITDNREDAEEVIQDAFLKSFKAIKSFKGNSKFSTWLYRIVYTTSISRTRNFNRIFSDLSNAGNISNSNEETSYIIEKEDRTKYLKLALNNLKAEDAIVISLFYYDEKSIEEIGEIIGNSNNNTKVKLFRARKKIEEFLIKMLKKEAKEII